MKNSTRWGLQPLATQLLPEQREHLIEMLKHVGWQKTGKEIFEAIMFSIFPATVSELAVVRTIGDAPHVLLWYRDDEYYKGYHLPGKYMLRGESDEDHVRRTLNSETGLALRKYELIRCFNTRPETGWVPGQQNAKFWYVEADGEPTVGKFFPLTSLPDDTLGHHRKYVDCLRAFLMRRKQMRGGNILWDGLHCASEWKWLCKTLDPPIHAKHFFAEFDTFGEALGFAYQNPATSLFDDMGQQIF